jgi:2-(1,2-epoxy-1,2-dihydrophenyl)acetyl-CoA isomerase
MNDFVVYERREQIALITLNRPAERNAISDHASCEALVDAVEHANGDATVKCLILTGAGSAFCAGGNVKTMLQTGGIGLAENPPATRANYRRGIQRIPLAIWNTEIPTIAAVNGAAIGAGCDLACMCDIRIASENAKFAESFLKLGLIPGDGGAWFLPRIVGYSKAAELTFTADTLDAQGAMDCGLVSKVVPAEALMPEVWELAMRIAKHPAQALRMSKRLLRESQHARLSELLELSAAFQALAHETSDHKEAVTAALEKRTPQFTGS